MTDPTIVRVRLPIKVVSVANVREHWRATAARAKLHRMCALVLLAKTGQAASFARCTVTMTRVGPRQLDDDNLAGGFKAARDGVADWLKLDDADKAIKWIYEQRKGGVREYAAEVVVSMEHQ